MDRSDPVVPTHAVHLQPRSARHRGHWLQIGHSHGFEWNHLDVSIPQLPHQLHGVRIVHLSDAHLLPRWKPAYDQLLARLADHPPDLVLFTGDLVDHKLDHRDTLPTAERFVKGLSARLGVFAIAGNHDGDFIGPRSTNWNINWIDRKFLRLESASAAVELIGLPSVRRQSFDPEWLTTLPPHTVGVPRIALGHYPDQVRYISSLSADLMLSGHTHGGQICLPNGCAIMTHDTLPKRMARGAHRFGPTTLVVNRGFGLTRWPIRIFCPAEVVEIRLTCE
ncbi:MAG TPA: metallophosphoesterase [Tepidisphaeraceae bacterium]|nr:metallophosphoesterase [Tepidisphaeraceae bacterium]